MPLPVQLEQTQPIYAKTLRKKSHNRQGKKLLSQESQEIVTFGLKGGKGLNAAVGGLLD